MSEQSGSSIKQVLELIGLSQDEIETYFNITGRGPVMVGEISLLSKVSEQRANEIANNLLEKGLVRLIPGKTPHYMALPPYAALLNQIHQFKELVENIQQTTPDMLEDRFKSIEKHSAKLQTLENYRDHIQEMKQSLPNQIKAQFSKFEEELEQVKKFHEIKQYILNLKEIVPEDILKEFDLMESRMDNIKSEISNAFETQFRVGALSKMAEKIVSRIISEQFGEMTEYFRKKFVQNIQGMLDEVIAQLGTLSDAAGDISTGLDETFEDIESGLRSTLADLDQKISGVYEDVTKGIQELKTLFQKEIFETLQEDIINNILNQLELSESTMQEFWDRAKKASMLTFKDVWFVRSAEGMMAQINDSISRVKMRFHLIAPKLENIDMVAIKNVARHVNVRISTNFDKENQNDNDIIKEIEEYPNITIRYYPRENLWAINKDFEEVVVCVVSKGSEGQMEIAGMGSILEEHVKLFAAVLEDVWIQSKKLDHVGISQSFEPGVIKEQTIKPSEIQASQQEDIEAPTEVSVSTNEAPIEEAKPQFEEYKTTSEDKAFLESSPEPPPTSVRDTLPLETPSEDIPTPIDQKSATINLSEEGSLKDQFDLILNSLSSLKGAEIAKALSDLQNNILEEKGYSSVLKQINLSSSMYKNVEENLHDSEISELNKKLNFWRKKLHL